MKLGIDIGGTYLRYELLEKNVIVEKESLESSSLGLCAFLERFLTCNSNITAVFISYAGQVAKGKILSAPNIKIDRYDLQEYIESKYDVELFLENDVNCAVLAEAAFFQSKDICAMYVGTGLGLGVVCGSHLLHGADNIAAELGHIPFKRSPFVCSCGKNNCVELFCSGSGLLRWKQKENLDVQLSLSGLKQSSNAAAQQIYNTFFEALLHTVGTVVTLFNPKVLVFGGGIIDDEKAILTQIQKKIQEYALPLAIKNLQIKKTQLKNAPLQGAFLLKDNYV